MVASLRPPAGEGGNFREHIILMADQEREILEIDVLFVGAGPASLAGALHLARGKSIPAGPISTSSPSSVTLPHGKVRIEGRTEAKRSVKSRPLRE